MYLSGSKQTRNSTFLAQIEDFPIRMLVRFTRVTALFRVPLYYNQYIPTFTIKINAKSGSSPHIDTNYSIIIIPRIVIVYEFIPRTIIFLNRIRFVDVSMV